MDELMLKLKLKENLEKGRKQAATKEGVVVKEGGPVQQEGMMVAETKDDNSWEDVFEKEEVVMNDLVEEQRQVPFRKVATEEGPKIEEKAEVKDTHGIDEMSVEDDIDEMWEEEVVMENELAQEIVKKDKYGFEDIFEKGEVTTGNVPVENVSEELKFRKLKPYICKEPCCGRKFERRKNLNKHIRSMHFNERPHPCKEPGCGKGFVSRGDLNRHIRTVHLKERPHLCKEPGCDKKFGILASLKTHVRTHEKLWACKEPGCDEKFLNRSGLDLHIRALHSNLTPFHCEMPNCYKTYGKKKELKKHIKILHCGESYTCTEPSCGKKFRQKQSLAGHIRAVHNKERPFACQEPGCTKKYGWLICLKYHQNVSHKFNN